MDKRQLNLLKDLKKEAVRLDWDIAFGGKAKGNRHLFRVNKIAKYLNKKEGGNKFITLAGAWVHDVSLAWGSDYNASNVRKYTIEFLKNFPDLTKEETNLIVLCATGHEGESKKLPIEAKIVHDADVVDKSGILGIIRHIWKMTNMIEGRILNKDQDVKKLKKHLEKREKSLLTKTANKLVRELNSQRTEFFKNRSLAFETTKVISQKASLGMTSDRIAASLSLIDCSPKMLKILREQLSCSYFD